MRAVRRDIKTVSFRAPVNESDLSNPKLFPWVACDTLVRVDCGVETSLLMPCDEHDTNHVSSLLTHNDFAQSNAVFDDSNSIISAFVLPEDIVWPSLGFYASAQEPTRGRRVLFFRGARHAVGTVHATVELHRNGKNAAWIGLPGIGKSIALSLLLLQLLQNAGEVVRLSHRGCHSLRSFMQHLLGREKLLRRHQRCVSSEGQAYHTNSEGYTIVCTPIGYGRI